MGFWINLRFHLRPSLPLFKTILSSLCCHDHSPIILSTYDDSQFCTWLLWYYILSLSIIKNYLSLDALEIHKSTLPMEHNISYFLNVNFLLRSQHKYNTTLVLPEFYKLLLLRNFQFCYSFLYSTYKTFLVRRSIDLWIRITWNVSKYFIIMFRWLKSRQVCWPLNIFRVI